MRSKPDVEAVQRLAELNSHLDGVERQLDTLEDLLEELWDRVVEPATAPRKTTPS